MGQTGELTENKCPAYNLEKSGKLLCPMQKDTNRQEIAPQSLFQYILKPT
jgi:hypothetical protein